MDRISPGHPGNQAFTVLLTARLRRGWPRTALFALIWWILTNGAPDSWGVGVPVALAATMVSVLLLPPLSLSVKGAARFIPFFLWHSLRGGVDVAWRVFHPRLPITPGLHRYRWRLPPGLARVFMANTVSLLPGTLSAEMDSEYLSIHVLDQESDPLSELKAVEVRVAELFGVRLAGVGTREPGTMP
ncbi:Na+/H+ antiporter subunit E [Thermodesulfobacteriota bacterium B35]